MAYDEAYYRSRETWRDWRIEAREVIRLAQIHLGTHVLEVGCGGGGLLGMLSEQGAFAVGVDTLQAALSLAQKQLDADKRGHTRLKEKAPLRSSAILVRLVRIGKDIALPFRNEAFDSIIGQHVIEHLPDASAVLREWHRLLKPSGRLALTTPNALYPDPAHFADADHTHIFSPLELRDAVQRAGFTIESCFTIFPFLTGARVLRAVGVIAYDPLRHVPYFSARGRTIVLAAKKN